SALYTFFMCLFFLVFPTRRSSDLTCLSCPKKDPFKGLSGRCQALVRFFALLRIIPHAPLLVRVPVNSFEFHSCERTPQAEHLLRDRKSTRLNSSHVSISYAVFCLK